MRQIYKFRKEKRMPEVRLPVNEDEGDLGDTGYERAAVAPEPAVAKSAAVRDPRVDPKVGDVVSPISAFKWLDSHPVYLVRAVVGMLIAYTTNASDEIKWIPREKWCEASPLIERYKVLHVAD
jgi:hypothetical protein